MKKLATFVAFLTLFYIGNTGVNAMFSSKCSNNTGSSPKINIDRKGDHLKMGRNEEIEMELTFLAREIPKEIYDVEPQVMVDTYIPDEGHAQLRVRQQGSTYVITKKIPAEGNSDFTKVMREISIPLTASEYSFLSSSGKRKVHKLRYNVVIDGFPAEVDIFQDSLAGLVMIDFEFSNISSRQAFKVPKVCLADVTREIFKAGGVLAGKSYEDLKADLDRFGYIPLFKD